MNKIVDQIEYQPNVPYQQLNQQIMDQNIYGSKTDELDQLLKDINIPDQVEFVHQFKMDVQNCCGYGHLSQHTQFDIQGIGELEFSVRVELTCVCICYCCRMCECDKHEYPQEVYILKNNNVQLEFWPGSTGKVFVNGKQIFEFLQTFPNPCDILNQHCCSSYPKLKIFSPIEKNYQLILKPDLNNFPESIFSVMSCTACLDIFNTSKNYYVDGLTQGRCQIINTRTACEAFARVSEMQGACCKQCPLIDYPRFAVQFDGVRKIDKIAIIMGLVHTSFYKQWVTLTNSLHLKFSSFLLK
ncbi:unnamed protein product [Paramecium primaurelia]|uniref:Uncharacterized protein n=1 Tax=Paramecium primaurelia TaxID=5886 RepID=A0A8S1QHP6_PARPR|nr:unnamed protein product [Paramecium primaurelia]